VRTAKGVYHQCIEFEEKAASIYLQLASHFSSDRNLSLLWLEMAMEEKQHAGLLQFCVAEELYVPELPAEASIEQVSRIFIDLEKRAADPTLTKEQAFSIAIEMESSEINAVFGRLTAALHDSTYLTKRKIATFVPNHLDVLINAARKFGVGDRVLRQAGRHLT
jgi:rubrerythrin